MSEQELVAGMTDDRGTFPDELERWCMAVWYRLLVKLKRTRSLSKSAK